MMIMHLKVSKALLELFFKESNRQDLSSIKLRLKITYNSPTIYDLFLYLRKNEALTTVPFED